jgi:hypothetical protein
LNLGLCTYKAWALPLEPYLQSYTIFISQLYLNKVGGEKPAQCLVVLSPQEHDLSWMPVAHTCNPNYSVARDQDDHGSKPAQANSLRDPILKETHPKKRLVKWIKV